MTIHRRELLVRAGAFVILSLLSFGPVTFGEDPTSDVNTIEDLQEDSGISFQGALGFYTSEGTTNTQPHASYGVGVDDLVIGWREFKLVQDTKDCTTGGQCADVEIQSTNFFEGNALLTLTVLDTVPYSTENPVNDCNLDQDFADAAKHCWNPVTDSGSNAACTTAGAACAIPGERCFSADDTDCDDNGVVDVVVEVGSEAEPFGEIVALNRFNVIGSGGRYQGNVPISLIYNSPGTIFLSKQGVDNPTVTVLYTDRNIVAGAIPSVLCKNDQDVNRQGAVTASTTVAVTAGELTVQSVRIVDNGDGDAFADTNETVSLFLTLINNSGQDLDTTTLGLSSNGTSVDCISRPVVDFGSIKAVDDPSTPLVDEHVKETPTPFVFHVSQAVNRVDENDILQATFTLTAQSDKFDVLARDTIVTLDLDLNALGGGDPTTYTEGFESGTFGSFTSMNLDDGKASNVLSDGYRCQYNDPDGPNPNEADRSGCFLGFPNAADNKYDWHIHTTAMNDGGRAYDGTRSLHLGVHPITGPSFDTTRLSQLDAIRTIDPINIGFEDVSPTLSFKHQISLVDNRTTSTENGKAADRGVVHVQLADNSGQPIGDWVKIFPFENLYDAQGVDHFFNCTFDPIDDGNDEDSFFDPSDPFRRTGPSSTCFPEFAFVFQGDTDYRNAPGNLTLIGRASDGPGLRGSIDRGTWIEPKFDFGPYMGRRLRMRFLFTSIEVSGTKTYDVFGFPANEVGDDGWYIDAIQVTDCLTSPPLFEADGNPNTGLPGCGACTAITPSLTADDTQLDAPGQIVTLDASASTVDICNGGVLQFQFWIDLFGDDNLVPGVDPLLRDWTDNPILLDAPAGNTRYAVAVRCSSDTSCGTSLAPNVATLSIGVTCPGIGGSLDPGPFPQTVLVSKGTSPTINLTWTTAALVDAIRGDLVALRSNGGSFAPTVEACLANNLTVNSVADSTVLAAGQGKYYVVRIGDPQCNEQGTWSTGTAQEAAGRNLEINASSNACP